MATAAEEVTLRCNTRPDIENLILSLLQMGFLTPNTDPLNICEYELTQKAEGLINQIGLPQIPDCGLTNDWYQSIVDRFGENPNWDIADFLTIFNRNLDPDNPHTLASQFISQYQTVWATICRLAYTNFTVSAVILCLYGISMHNEFATP